VLADEAVDGAVRSVDVRELTQPGAGFEVYHALYQVCDGRIGLLQRVEQRENDAARGAAQQPEELPEDLPVTVGVRARPDQRVAGEDKERLPESIIAPRVPLAFTPTTLPPQAICRGAPPGCRRMKSGLSSLGAVPRRCLQPAADAPGCGVSKNGGKRRNRNEVLRASGLLR